MTCTTKGRVVVVGSGLAGLVCALELTLAGCDVLVLSAGRAGRDGATNRVHALAPWLLLTAPWARPDSPARFAADLERRAAGLARPGLSAVLAEGSRQSADWLVDVLDLAPLDAGPITLAGDRLPRGRRFCQRRPGPLLAGLVARCHAAGVALLERTLAVGLLLDGERACGVLAFDRSSATLRELASDAVVLACGGFGAVFPAATTARFCCGSGLALGRAAGVLLHRADLTQALPVAARPRLFFPGTAAICGGRVLIAGEPSPAGDLEEMTVAVARALRAGAPVELEAGEAAALLPERLKESVAFRSSGRVPLMVAVHHSIGGVAIDAWGRTSLPALYACGEAAGGVQGARRTMGTGLLEAAVFGARAGRAVARDLERLGPASGASAVHAPAWPRDAGALERRLDRLMGPLAVIREHAELERAAVEIAGWPAGAADNETSYTSGLRRAAAAVVLDAARDATAPEANVASGGRQHHG